MLFPTIKNECKQFILQSNGIPMYKTLPSNKEPFVKIKARHRRAKDDILSKAFDLAFDDKNLLNRAIFCNTKEQIPEGYEKYYVFPVDGYDFLYSPRVQNTSVEYRDAILKTMEIMDDNNAMDFLKLVLSNEYINYDISTALREQYEIIIYNIPFFYAIKCSFFNSLEEYTRIIYE